MTAFYGKAKLSPILGDEQFRAWALEGRVKDIDIPDLKRARPVPSLEEIITVTAERFGVDAAEIRTSRRGRGVISPARSAAMYVCQQVGDMRLREIADAFGLASYASAGSGIRRIKQRIEKDGYLARRIKRILLDLTPSD